MKRRRRAPLAAAAFWLAVLGAATVLVHRRHVARSLLSRPDVVKPRERPRGTEWVSDERLRALGWLEADMPRGRPGACAPRRPGVTRLGAFGDSFTYGDEVETGADYPAQLEGVLRREGARVEVYNYGVRAYSFAQAYLLWEAVRERGCIDAAVFGPSLWAPDRDLTLGDRAMHARLALEGDGLKVVVPSGSDALDQRDRALRLLPPVEQWRYERRAPTPLAMWLPAGKTLRNPFYYFRGSPREEQRLLYARLLGRLADSGMPVLVFGPDREWLELAPKRGGLWRAVTRQPLGAAAQRPFGHQSPLGNLAVAEQVACALLGRPRCATDGLSFSLRTADEPGAAGGGPALSFGAAGPAEFSLQQSVDGIVETLPGAPDGPLLAFEQAGFSWLDLPLLPLDPAPSPGTPVVARWRRAGKSEEARIGTVVSRWPRLAVARISWDIDVVWRRGLRLTAGSPAGDLQGLWVGGRRVLARCGPDLFCPETGRYFRAYLADARKVPAGASGPVELRAGASPALLGRWTRVKKAVALDLAGPEGCPLCRR